MAPYRQDSLDERLENEVALVQAMYPDQVTWNAHSREILFKNTNSAITLRLQDDYLTTGRPVVVSASVGKRDMSGEVKKRLIEEFSPGEEVLDATIMIFDELVAHHELEASSGGGGAVLGCRRRLRGRGVLAHANERRKARDAAVGELLVAERDDRADRWR